MHLVCELDLEETLVLNSNSVFSTRTPIHCLSNWMYPVSGYLIRWTAFASSTTICSSPRSDVMHLCIYQHCCKDWTPPLCIATDTPNPAVDSLFSIYPQTFLCIFFLSDFTCHLTPLDALINPYDQVPLKGFWYRCWMRWC
ncbi:uncharacterized protein BJ212DRAFT_1551443 [Suillus subaureus]|uniref:Uncharacterized protein n=1 Tax=Suillus subaureus TaxID=48587 RepID=A0A9P7DU84_9AGAM|nr:uncharacterized protein BJ212DRAFT_1551443 [Suillus subaureus]KAG1803040.1 hypothetical protein BJ212DRAFT_1551443 [Suillus subaureus]